VEGASGPFAAELLGHRFLFQTAPGLFSAGRVDDGTRLLLSYLPDTTPRSVLDLGCGYGALGLPVAARFPSAEVSLVDRDLLAVDAARQNATSARLTNVKVFGSLGYRETSGRFDWVLCNVPARIGEAAIEYIVGAGGARLTSAGELRIVVIRDLEPTVQHLAADRGWPVEHVTSNARHGVFRCRPLPAFETDHESMYLRDLVTLTDSLTLQRPHDISEDPGHLRDGLPLLLECLPKKYTGPALVFRGGYGAAAIALARRGASVLAVDRDVLATTYLRRNAMEGALQVKTIDALVPPPALDRFELVVGELTASVGRERAVAEIEACLGNATGKASVLWLGLSRTMREWLSDARRFTISTIASRGLYSVIRVVPRSENRR
jgi:16S rRNA (guanine1207-N2)-methyltransferase